MDNSDTDRERDGGKKWLLVVKNTNNGCTAVSLDEQLSLPGA